MYVNVWFVSGNAITPLTYALTCTRMPAQGMNEIGDTGCSELAVAVGGSSGNELLRLQLRLNRCRNDGAVRFAVRKNFLH